MAIDIPDKIEQNVLKGINKDFSLSNITKQPQTLNFLAERMRVGLNSLSDNAITFLDDNVMKYIEEFKHIRKKKPLDSIYSENRPMAEAMALTPKVIK